MAGASQIQVDCPKCLASIQVPSDRGGTRVECPKCQHSLLVPDSQTAGNSIFDDLFDAPAEAATGTPEPESPQAPPAGSAENRGQESTADTSESTVADSMFDDIDLALEQHQSGDIPPSAPPVIRPPREAPKVPSVSHIEEEIELPESEEQPLPEIPIEDPVPEVSPEPESVADALNLDVELDDSGLTIEDDFSLDEHLKVEELDLNESAENDPFQEGSNEPLRIDGISPTVKADDIYGVKCKVCDTRIHVNIDQAGLTIECPICYSEVLVDLPKTGEENANQPVSNSELRLQPPIDIEKPKLEIPTDVPLDPAKESEPDLDDGGLTLAPLELNAPSDIGLSLETRDLLSPTEPAPQEEQLFDDVDASTGTLKSKSDEAPEKSKRSKKSGKKEKAAEYGSKDYWQSKVTDASVEEDPTPEILLTEFLTPDAVAKWLARNFTSADLIFRTLLAMVMFALTFTMFDIFHDSYNNEDVAYFNKILGTVFPILIGGVSLAVGTLVLFTTCSMVFQNSASGVATTDEWPGFSFSDWLGPLAFFTFSFWLGCLPGGLFGALIALAVESNTWIVVFASFSAFMLSPLLLTSACYTGSAFGVISMDVVKSFRFDQVHWLYYLPYVLALWVAFFLGTMILYLPTFIFSGVGAAIQVFTMLCFASVAGLHAGRIATKLQKRT